MYVPKPDLWRVGRGVVATTPYPQRKWCFYMGLTPNQRETHIWYNEDEDVTYAETAIRRHLTKLRSRPGLTLVRAIRHEGEVIVWRFEGKGDLIQFPRGKRIPSDKQRENAAKMGRSKKGATV